MEVVPTGMRGIDSDLRSGGLPAGSTVTVEYPPGSAGEAVLWTIVARGFHPDVPDAVVPDGSTVVTPDRVTYVTTATDPATIAGALDRHGPTHRVGEGTVPIEFERADGLGDGTPSAATIRAPDAERPGIVVDAASDLLALGRTEAALDFLTAVRSTVREQRGIGLLAVVRQDRQWSPPERSLLQRSDAHVRFDPGRGSASAAVRFSHVRGAAGPVDGFPAVFDLDIGRRVSVDTVERG